MWVIEGKRGGEGRERERQRQGDLIRGRQAKERSFLNYTREFWQ